MKTDSRATRESKHDLCVEIACNLMKNNDPSKKLNWFTLYRVLIIFHQFQAAQISRQISEDTMLSSHAKILVRGIINSTSHP